MKISSKAEIDGALNVTFETGEKFVIFPHLGRDAKRASLMLRRTSARTIEASARMRQAAEAKFSKEERARVTKLQEFLDDDSLLPSEKEPKEKELEAIYQKHIDQTASLLATAESLKDLDPELELETDLVLFSRTTGPNGALSDPAIFDLTFAGKKHKLLDILRREIGEFNGFLEPAESPQLEKTQNG